MRRLADQAMILRAIGEVRFELEVAHAANSPTAEIYDVLKRLTSLYALLNVEQLEQAIAQADDREELNKAA